MNPDVAYEEGSIVPVKTSSLEDLINDKIQQKEQQEQQEQSEEIAQLEQSEQLEEVKPVTIEIANKKAVLRHVKPQESKYWHFKFSDLRHTNQMTNVLQNIQGYRLTVEYGVPINTADITLKNNGEVVGKIHLLLCDKRDANLPNKYYCKLYFYHFKNPQLFQAVKTALVNFFENFKVSQKPSIRPIKRRSLTKRKSLAKRSMAKRTSLTKRRSRPVK
jgi:hypothetical protein